MKRGQEILNKEQDILACLDSTLETSDEEIPATPQVPRRGGIGGRGGSQQSCWPSSGTAVPDPQAAKNKNSIWLNDLCQSCYKMLYMLF